MAFLLLLSLVACGNRNIPDQELGLVSGVVLLDNQPLGGAQITFTPLQNGAMSYGTTDTQGKYELIYSPGIPGAVLGMHEVRISKVGGPDSKFDTLEMLPVEYNSKSKLTAEVQAGKNTLDYSLKSHSGSSKK